MSTKKMRLTLDVVYDVEDPHEEKELISSLYDLPSSAVGEGLLTNSLNATLENWDATVTVNSTPEKERKDTLAIITEGGVVQSVVSDEPMDNLQVLVVDYDDSCGDPRLVEVPQFNDDGTVEQINAVAYMMPITPSRIGIDEVLRQLEELDASELEDDED